jgi:hypothetical protein
VEVWTKVDLKEVNLGILNMYIYIYIYIYTYILYIYIYGLG